MMRVVVRSLALTVALAGCDFAFRLDSVGPARDAPHVDAAVDAVTFGPWSTPKVVTEVNTTFTEGDMSVTGDALELYIASNRAGDGVFRVYRATRDTPATPFSTPVAVDELVAQNAAFGEISEDGLSFYYGGTGPGGDEDIFVMTRASRMTTFASPMRVDALSSVLADRNPHIGAGGTLALVTHINSSSDFDIVMYERASPADSWGPERALGEVNTQYRETDPTLSSDGLTLMFASDRRTRDNVVDLYVATRPSRDVPFEAPVIIDALVSDYNDSDPCMLADERTLYFIRMGDVLVSTRSPL